MIPKSVLFALLAGGALALVVATWWGRRLAAYGFPLPAPDRRIGCVDGLRGYLALAVMVHHFAVWLQITRFGGVWAPPAIKVLNQLGAGGVGLFFMTTGLVFYPRVLAGWRGTSWPATYTTRVFRILPLMLLSLIVVLAIVASRTGRPPDSHFPLAALHWLTGRGEPGLLGDPEAGRVNAYVLWSLYYEWVFYLLVLPACALAMDACRGRLPTISVPLLLLGVAVLARAVHGARDLPLYLPLFAVGMLAHECTRSPHMTRVLRTRGAAVAALLALAIGATVFATPYSYALPCFALFFACVACGNDFGGVFRSAGALVLGECSYSIYLLHGIVLSLLFTEGAGVLAGWPSATVTFLLPIVALVVTAVASVTYRVVERPAIRLGGRLARHWTGRRLSPRSPQVEVAP